MVNPSKQLDMVEIVNESLQAFEMYLITEIGVKEYWITPGKRITVPRSYISDQVRNLENRRIITISGN